MRKTLLLLLLLASSCQRTSNWTYRHIEEMKSSGCTQITYHSPDQSRGIDVEFLSKEGLLSAYLQVHSHPIVPSPLEKEMVEVHLHSRNGRHLFLAPIREGNYRVRLSQELQEELIKELISGHTVTIELSGYSVTIDATEFQAQYSKLERHPLQIPFSLYF